MNIRQLVGVQARSSWAEKALSGAGAFTAIAVVFFCTDLLASFDIAMALLPSMGASAVLAMSVPHGTLSQPWPIVAGNSVSAFVGVTVALAVSDLYLGAGLAVGVSIAVMHFMRCIHPPGGATALVPVIGGESIQSMGYGFVLAPTLLNCLLIVAVAIVFNNCFRWRRYPAALMTYDHSMYHPETYSISARHIQLAMESMDEVIDISPAQVKYLVDKADEIMISEQVPEFKIVPGGYYTNGASGRKWSVRQVIDISNHANAARRVVIFRTVDGALKGESGTVLLYEFRRWAKEEMRPV